MSTSVLLSVDDTYDVMFLSLQGTAVKDGVRMVVVLDLLVGKLTGTVISVVVVFSKLVVSMDVVVGADFCGVVSFNGEFWVLAVNELNQLICLSIYKRAYIVVI